MTEKSSHIVTISIVVVFCIIFAGTIAINGFSYTKKTTNFKEKCAAAGGIPYAPKGVKGWPKFICFDKDAIIIIEDEQ